MSNENAIYVHEDGLILLGERDSGKTVMAKFWTRVNTPSRRKGSSNA